MTMYVCGCGSRSRYNSYWDEDYEFDPEGRVLVSTKADIEKLSIESLKEMLKLAEAQGKYAWKTVIREVLEGRESK